MVSTAKAEPTVSPKLFVSYSWTNPDHEAWVLRLATELRESGIDVILDKWDLKEGHDAHAFMEKMVTDPEIRKVILICDKLYAEKTDGRTGGVGTEAQIISGEIYQRQDQDKFVAVLKERDENGKAYLPVYYRSRIYIDLSDPESYSTNFEKLLRWVYGQPLDRKPELGKKPVFLSSEEDGAVSLATSSRLKRALDAIRNSRAYALPATAEYFELLAEEFEKLRIESNATPFDDAVVQNIEAFLPYRNEVIEVFVNLALYLDNAESRTVIHRFFERIIPYMYCPKSVATFRDWDWDNFSFIIHELFLYAVAIFIRYERFESAAFLMSNGYYVPEQIRFGNEPIMSFIDLRKPMRSLEFRNQRLQLQRLSVRADFLRDRCKHVAIGFTHLMQTDLILFMRSEVELKGKLMYWWPETLVFEHGRPFEVFARSQSKAYFNRVKVLLGIEQKTELDSLFEEFKENARFFPRWQYQSFNPASLMGFKELATKP